MKKTHLAVRNVKEDKMPLFLCIICLRSVKSVEVKSLLAKKKVKVWTTQMLVFDMMTP